MKVLTDEILSWYIITPVTSTAKITFKKVIDKHNGILV